MTCNRKEKETELFHHTQYFRDLASSEPKEVLIETDDVIGNLRTGEPKTLLDYNLVTVEAKSV